MILTIPTKDLLITIFFFSVLIFYIIYDWKNVYFSFFANPKGKIYNILYKKIQQEKNRKNYNPNIVLNKYFSEAQIISKNENEIVWTEDKNFWYRVYLDYPDEIILKLENGIEKKDIQYFEGLAYSEHPLSIETQFDVSQIKKLIKDKAASYAKRGDREQAVRLGYFYIKGKLVTPESDTQECWLELWNKELKDLIDKPLTSIDLIKNPWCDGARRSEKSINYHIMEINLFFYKIKWKTGIDLVEKGKDQ